MGYSDFSDFVSQHDYMSYEADEPAFDSAFDKSRYEEAIKQNPRLAAQHVQNTPAQDIAENVAERISQLGIQEIDDHYAINQTINAAVGIVAEADPADPSSGKVHHVLFVQGDNPRTYVFTENVRVNEDGTATSTMEDGQGWDMPQAGKQMDAYTSLVGKFADVAAPATRSDSLVRKFEASSGRDLAEGGVRDHAGEYEIRHQGGRAAVASAGDVNETTAFEVESSYGPGGDAEMKLTIFRENADGMTAVTGAAPGIDNQAKYDAFSSMAPGINRLSP